MSMPRVPASLMRADRAQLDREPLVVHEGRLPDELRGHVFVIAPVGTIASGGRPYAGATTLLVGDGLLCRFDFENGAASVTTRLLRTPDFVADEVTHGRADLHAFRFTSSGLLRIGLLGSRDFSNTALVPMAIGADAPRMISTFDAGRPHEVDPMTLAIVSPVGARSEWRAEALPDLMFPLFLSPAHPAFDARTGELFTVNYGRGVGNFAATVPLVYALSRMPAFAVDALERVAGAFGHERGARRFFRALERITTRIDRHVEAAFDRKLPFVPDTFTDLVRWTGGGALERWRLVLPDANEVAILQSVHQIAVTRDHVVILETGFKIGLQSGFNDPVPHADVVDRAVRAILTRPQLPVTVFYVVRRADLKRTDLKRGDDGVLRVPCKRVEIPIEADHFLADYDDSNGIVLHVAHAPATDLSEWIRPYDRSVYGLPQRGDLEGMMAVGAMDVGRFGRYVVRDGRVEDASTIADQRLTWAIALYAGAGINTAAPLPERIDRLYWCTEGFFPELLTEFVFDLYESYAHREVPASAILAMKGGAPSAILALDTSGPRIADSYELPPGAMAGSMQHVMAGSRELLFCTVYTEPRMEVWIFDARALAQGPICKLHCDRLIVGFSLHTAFLERIAPRTAGYAIASGPDLAPHAPEPQLWHALGPALERG